MDVLVSTNMVIIFGMLLNGSLNYLRNNENTDSTLNILITVKAISGVILLSLNINQANVQFTINPGVIYKAKIDHV